MTFDFNVHLNLPSTENGAGNIQLDDETILDVTKLLASYRTSRKEFVEQLSNANFMLFNEDLPFGDHPVESFISEVKNDFPNAEFTQLLNFRHPQLSSGLDRIKALSIRGVKFHSYVQKITDTDIPIAVRAA